MSELLRWLDRIYAIRSGPEIEMGLERIRPVFDAMNVRPACPVFLVGGTNGKGSTCAYIDAMLRASGYKTARYTSPHIHRFNERIVVNGVEASDEQLVAAFEAVELARTACGTASQSPQGLALTFFEYTTLAAFHIFSHTKLDAWVIEVGLGGRLDATNILEPDCSVITSIALDHTEFLGTTREQIAKEKAGILRANKPAIIAEADPPQSLCDAIVAKKANALLVGKDFGWLRYEAMPTQWGFWVGAQRRHGLPIPALRGIYQLGNAAAALAALHTLSDTLPVSQGAIRQGLLEVEWPGRFQVLPGRPTVVLDVAHNEHAAKALESALSDMAYFPETVAVFGMLKDKDLVAVVNAVKNRIDRWHIAPLPGERGATVETLAAALNDAGVKDRAIARFATVADAFAAAKSAADEADRIVVFGSFLTVAACSA